MESIRLKKGDRAPSFTLLTDEGETVTLSDFSDRFLILYFYPKDQTPGCTREAQAFSARIADFEQHHASILGVSKDSTESHHRFRVSCRLEIPLASDPDLTVHKLFGAYGEKNLYGKITEGVIRSTFLIRPDKKIEEAFYHVKVEGHVDKVFERLCISSEENAFFPK
ncbi:peroxiredoxin [Pajaroellobacter abortibovis]|uniref:thioredoxin-dependent peroxiredoxin n=1 Tax=Pajaroellobacter abortibovis TaxID=1882918 RepID=A0A1L6MWZ5_9BACT|nr:peroxiredoxin [Pajaroellobacter abortibovis]APS00054.1 hypothetical protein BCY86_04690 [Pajaroellobacter abortibovis]